MSSHSYITDPDQDICSNRRDIRVEIVERYCNGFRDVVAQCRKEQEENYLSASCLRELLSLQSDAGIVGSHVRLRWYWDCEIDFVEDEFKIVQPSDFDIVLGADACERIREHEEDDEDEEEVVEFFTMMLEKKKKSKSKEQRAIDKANEERRIEKMKLRDAELAKLQVDEQLAAIQKETQKNMERKAQETTQSDSASQEQGEGKGKSKA